jgi:hypothetical protein
VNELLGVLCYGYLVSFDRLASDARLAPDLERRAVLCGIAAGELAHHERLVARLKELGADPEAAMAPFVAALDDFHDSTKPRSWLEGLVKVVVGDGIVTDFYREVADFLPEPDRSLVQDILRDTRRAEFATAQVRAAIEADPELSGPLALWARRLVGEAISQAQRVAAERDALTELVLAGSGDLMGVAELIKRVTAGHSDRMRQLGLNN